MKTKLLMLTAVMSCVFAGNAMALTKEEYKAQNDRISAELQGQPRQMRHPEGQRQGHLRLGSQGR